MRCSGKFDETAPGNGKHADQYSAVLYENDFQRDLDNGKIFSRVKPDESPPAAFVYRTKYNPSCMRRAHPWEPDAELAHQKYATDEWQKKARKLARASAWKFRQQQRSRRNFKRRSVRRSSPRRSGYMAAGLGSLHANRKSNQRYRPRRNSGWKRSVFNNDNNEFHLRVTQPDPANPIEGLTGSNGGGLSSVCLTLRIPSW